jgi:tRNA A-37 threonylcarbamoyl transferase component Bud32
MSVVPPPDGGMTHTAVMPRRARTSAPAPPPTDSFRNVGFARYKLLHRVGEGAMAAVFVAYDPELDRRVALKLVRTDGKGDSVGWSRVQREARALARISHPNVVTIHEVGRADDQVFVAMEFVDGLTLDEWQRVRPRALPEILALYVQAGRGLIAAHGVGVIHRDFKPANVLVGEDGRARVADFGLARFLDSAEPGPGDTSPGVPRSLLATETGLVVGTPAYMSPEQHAGHAVDERSDQFSFCAALYEAVCGVRPFAGDNVDEIGVRVAAGWISPPLEGVFVPPALQAALLRGLSLRPDDRWPSLRALLDHIERIDLSRDGAAAQRQRRIFAALFVALVALAVGAINLQVLLDPAAVTPGHLLGIACAVLVAELVGVWFVRATLLRRRLHATMIAALLWLTVATAGGLALGTAAGWDVPASMLALLFASALVGGVLAAQVLRALWPIPGVYLVAIAWALLDPDNALSAQLLAALCVAGLIAVTWARAARSA